MSHCKPNENTSFAFFAFCLIANMLNKLNILNNDIKVNVVSMTFHFLNEVRFLPLLSYKSLQYPIEPSLKTKYWQTPKRLANSVS